MNTDLLAGETKIFSQQGGRFYFVSGEGELYVKLITGGDTRTFKLLVGQGVDFGNGRFTSVEITNGQTAQNIEFEIYDREVFDNRVPGLLDVDLVVAPLCIDIEDKPISSTGTDTIPQDLSRKRVVVYASPNNADYLRIGPNAAANRGVPIPPGGSISYEGTFEIRVHNGYSLGPQSYGYYSEGK